MSRRTNVRFDCGTLHATRLGIGNFSAWVHDTGLVEFVGPNGEMYLDPRWKQSEGGRAAPRLRRAVKSVGDLRELLNYLESHLVVLAAVGPKPPAALARQPSSARRHPQEVTRSAVRSRVSTVTARPQSQRQVHRRRPPPDRAWRRTVSRPKRLPGKRANLTAGSMGTGVVMTIRARAASCKNGAVVVRWSGRHGDTGMPLPGNKKYRRRSDLGGKDRAEGGPTEPGDETLQARVPHVLN